ncbi:MAG: ABC transporter permease [Alphaproteobacteria bacterium]|nr:ABC transporter permease [Alphaproteobacteria bacterium]
MANPYSTPTEKLGRAVYLTACGLVFTFLMAPVLVIIPLSFNAEPYFTYPLAGISMRWYEDFFDTMVWQLALKNSLIIGAAATVLATVLGTITALGLSGANFPLKPVVIGLLISPMMVPIVIVGVGLYFFYARIGLVNSYLGMITAHTTLAIPFVVITVTATLAGFDATLARAGASLGAGPARVFFTITLPLILPGVISGALFAFVTSFDEVVVALFLAGSEHRTLPRQMWAGIREQISPTITAVATMLIVFSVLLMIVMEALRRRSARLRGIES